MHLMGPSVGSRDRWGRAGGIGTGLTAMVGPLLRIWPRETSLTTDFVLAHLQRVGPVRLTELAQAAGVTQPTMTELVARLSDAGIIERRRHSGDGRVVLVALTEAGAASIERRRQLTADRLSQLIAALSPADIEVLDAALPALDRVAALIERAAVATGGD